MPAAEPTTDAAENDARFTIGCVSYLNAKPLIHGVEDELTRVEYAVPSALLDGLLGGRFDLALCPVMDAIRHADELEIVPVGGIGCAGPTFTVRLFSRVPIDQVERVFLDTDSHTSVELVRIILREQFGRTPDWIDHDFARPLPNGAQAALLIGDKVVTRPPDANDFPHELDLGEAWHELTGLPFVFAVWMTRPGTELDELPETLTEKLERNLRNLDEIVAAYAAAHAWPRGLARAYLGDILRFRIGEAEREAIRRFAGLVTHAAPAAGPMPAFREPTTASS